MPQLNYGIPDVYESVTRPTNMNIIRSIINSTGIPEDTFIEYAGQNDGIPTYRTLLTNNRNTEPAKMSIYDKVQVTVEEEIKDEYLFNIPFVYDDKKTIWKDPKLPVWLQPVYEHVETTLSFRYRVVDLNKAKDWQTGMRRKLGLAWKDGSFQSSYKFVVPKLILLFLEQFHKMKEAVAPEGTTLPDWLQAHAIQPNTVLTTQAGTQPEWAFKENELDILGYFDFSQVPVEEKKQDTHTYEVSFTFKFQWERPIELVLGYPLVIHNQLVPKKFRPDNVIYDPGEIWGAASKSMSRYHQLMEAAGFKNHNSRGGMIIPFFDEFWPTQIGHDLTNLVQFMIQVKDDPTMVLDLKNIPGFTWNEKLLGIMTKDHKGLTKRTQSVVNIVLYIGDRPLDSSRLYVDENLVVRSTVPLKLTDVHHLRINLYTQLAFLTKEATDTLRSNPEWANLIFTVLEPEMYNQGLLPKSLKNIWIPDDEWWRCIQYLKQTDAKLFGPRVVWPTVMNMVIVANLT
ncbi:hypothetical protein [Erwinia phage vB_Ea277G]|jgi:hypothetical protein|nr:hypothetical protein [Erwinia phage vB_Ea277G]